MGKKTFLSLFIIVNLLLFLFLNASVLLKLSFFVNFLILLYLTYYNIYIEKRFSPFLSVFIVFQALFFIVAPLIQIDDIIVNSNYGTGKFIQGFPFKENICIRANYYIAIFNVVFFAAYLFFKQKTKTYNYNPSKSSLLIGVIILFAFSIFIFLFNFNTILFQYQNEYYKEAEQTTVSSYLMVQKFLFFLPFAGLILAKYYLNITFKENKNYKIVWYLMLFFLILIIVLKNPLTEKRNALGPLYITILFMFFTKQFASNFRVTRFMFIIMVLLFPIITIITHSRHSLTQMISKPILIQKNIEYLSVNDAFNSLHYDAYPNFLATIDYRDKKEVVNGRQLLCSVFFFVPRKIWENKPETTGFLIGYYLIEKYKFNWYNLSNPYISEGYINFGFFGILLFAIILAYVFAKLVAWIESKDYLKIVFSFYFSIYLMYFLRGDLTNGIAFIFAFWLAVYFVPKATFSLLSYYAKR